MVRFAEAPDIPAICNIRRQVHKVHSDGRPDIYRMPESVEQIAEFDRLLSEISSQENYRLIVCETEHTITGYALLRLVTSQNLCMKQNRYSYFIEQFGMQESMRRQGIGTELMNGILDMAKADHADAVDLDVWAFNENAEQFYRSLGMTTKHTFLELPL